LGSRESAIKEVLSYSLVIAWASSVVTFASWRGFHPNSRHDLSMESGRRLFSVAIDSADGTVLVKAADWPHTFLRPFTLGESNWPERFTVSKFYWSKDKSVVVFQAQEKGENRPIYVGYYDFRDHKALSRDISGEPKDVCHAKIEKLLSERGGREDKPIEIPAPNTGAYETR
jgi:hypothetical protein